MDNGKLPDWLKKYNFLCLLNLPDAIEELGPLRFNYEGSTEGEGFIPMVKPLLSQGMRSNWQKNLAHRFYRKRAMKLVIRDAKLFIDNSPLSDHFFDSNFRRKMFHKYKRWQTVHHHFQNGLPISVVVLRDGFVGAVVRDPDAWLLVPVRFINWDSTCCGLHYFKVQLFEVDPHGEILRHVINFGHTADVASFTLLLPKLTGKNYIHSEMITWTVVGAEYERLSQQGNIQTVYNLPINLMIPNNTLIASNLSEEYDEWDDNVTTADI